jgi:hypothetical protein
MNEVELKLRQIAERIKQIKPEDLVGKESIISELDEKTKQLHSLYDGDRENLKV